jgi:acetyl-CoA carboxylase biotin carboxyl carrier protein
VLSYEQIKELVELVSRHRLGTFELERSGFRLRIDGRTISHQGAETAPGADSPLSGAPGSLGAAEVAASAERPAVGAPAAGSGSQADAGAAGPAAGAHVLNSPIVGTFYAAAAQDAEPFVRVGERVRKGQVLCIVEAMKLMNEIESDVDGVVVEIFPRNAQPVEFGEPLFAIRVG